MKTIQLPPESVELYTTFASDSDAYITGFADGMRQQAQFSKIRLAKLLSERAKPEAPASGAEATEPTK